MAGYGPRLERATDQEASTSEGAATVLVSPCHAVSDADMSKALVPRDSMPAAQRDRGFVARNIQSLAPSDGRGRAVARLAREGEAGNQSVDIAVQATQLQVGNVVVGNIRAEVEVEGKRKIVRQEIDVTDDGTIALRQYTLYERYVYRRIFEVMYAIALNEPEEEKETKKEKCIDFCCLACICNCSRRKSLIRTKDYMTPALRRGRAKGWVMHSQIVFPFISDTIREILVSFELITVLIAFALSAATFSLGKNEVFNILHLVLTIIGTVLAVIDGLFSLSGCRICKGCIDCCCGKKERPEGRRAAGSDKDLLPDLEEERSANSDPSGCRKCLNATKTKLDFVRMILTEVLLYPLLICDIFELITTRPYKFQSVTDGLSVVLFGISTISLVLYVYIVRLAILAGVIHYTQKQRQPKKEHQGSGKQRQPKKEHQESGARAFDYSISKSARYFLGYFFYHVLVQMIAQILMIVAISFKIEYENRHLFDDSNTDKSIKVSNKLWFLLAGGYVFPIFGFLTFFIVTYFWAQEFPIGLCIDLLSILQMPGMENITNFRESAKEHVSKMEKITRHIHFTELKDNYKYLHNRNWFADKFGYPFESPVLVSLCVCYTALQFAFVVCAEPEGNQIGVWHYVYLVSILVGGVANLYVFVVTLVWTTLFFVLLSTLPWVLLFCLCVSCVKNCNEMYESGYFSSN